MVAKLLRLPPVWLLNLAKGKSISDVLKLTALELIDALEDCMMILSTVPISLTLAKLSKIIKKINNLL
jgi:hypothetical protein